MIFSRNNKFFLKISLLLFLSISSSYAFNFQALKPVSQKLLLRLGAVGSVTAGTGYLLKQQYDREQELPYTINLMWINRDLQTQKSLFQDKEDAFAQSCLSNVYTWATCNPKSTINLWFDSTLTSEHAVKHTQSIIAEHMKKYPRAAPIILKDIRELAHVEKHPDVFSNKTPVYFRADLLRVVAGLETVRRSKRNNCFVYADFDVTPMNQKDLFDETTLKNLKKYGLVMTAGGHLGFENSFYMLSSQASNMQKALALMIVDLNTQRAYNGLRGKIYNLNNRRTRDPMEPLQQIVYDSYPSMFEYFYHLEKMGILKVCYPPQPFDVQSHGLEPFGLKRLIMNNTSFEATNEELKQKICESGWRHRWVPTKTIECPPASMNYS